MRISLIRIIGNPKKGERKKGTKKKAKGEEKQAYVLLSKNTFFSVYIKKLPRLSCLLADTWTQIQCLDSVWQQCFKLGWAFL